MARQAGSAGAAYIPTNTTDAFHLSNTLPHIRTAQQRMKSTLVTIHSPARVPNLVRRLIELHRPALSLRQNAFEPPFAVFLA